MKFEIQNIVETY